MDPATVAKKENKLILIIKINYCRLDWLHRQNALHRAVQDVEGGDAGVREREGHPGKSNPVNLNSPQP